MVSLKPFNKYSVVGNSLIESVIAISIIAICLLVALKLYVMIMEGRPSTSNQVLRFEVDKLVSEMKINPNYEPQNYNFKTFRIKKVISDYMGYPNVIKVSYFVLQKSDTTVYHYLFVKNEGL